jgi:hypothetical protein
MATTLTPDQRSSRERYSSLHKSNIESETVTDESKSPNQSTLWESRRSYILTTNYRYTSCNPPIADFALDMQDLWHIFIQAARITAADDPAQDRLGNQLLYMPTQWGTLRRKKQRLKKN